MTQSDLLESGSRRKFVHFVSSLHHQQNVGRCAEYVDDQQWLKSYLRYILRKIGLHQYLRDQQLLDNLFHRCGYCYSHR